MVHVLIVFYCRIVWNAFNQRIGRLPHARYLPERATYAYSKCLHEQSMPNVLLMAAGMNTQVFMHFMCQRS